MLFKIAPVDDRPALDRLVARAAAEAAMASLERQSQLLNLYRGHQAVIALARQLIESRAAAGDWQPAELLLLRLRADPSQRAWATERLARLWMQAGFAADAAHFYHVLERDHAADHWDGTRSVGQFIQELRANDKWPKPADLPICDWHNRELKSLRSGSNFDSGGITKTFNLRGAGLPFFRRHRLQFIPHESR